MTMAAGKDLKSILTNSSIPTMPKSFSRLPRR